MVAISTERRFKVETPYYHMCGKTKAENIRFRKWCLDKTAEDEKWAEELWIMCSRDPLFYINTFVWTFDPRLVPNLTAVPFFTFKFQDNAIKEIIEAILNQDDLLIEKSRDMGASWLVIACFEWLWHFRPMQSFLMGSRNEQLVDKTEDPKSLFWKIDFILKNLPSWLRPNYARKNLHLYNKDNGSTIDGESTTGEFARGDRRTAILLDEFATHENGHAALRATRDATGCRLFNSTPKGCGNAFYDMKMNPGCKKLRFHWSDDPRKNQGLYTTDEDGNIKILDKGTVGYFKLGDKEYFYPDDYPFVIDVPGKLRSPWYDAQCKRVAHPSEIAQELDIDYLGSDYQFFYADELQKIIENTIKNPRWEGEVDIDMEALEVRSFTPRPGGRFKIWAEFDEKMQIDKGIEVVCGVDVSTGTGASNSVIDFGNATTCEDVAEFVCPNTSPDELAKIAVALARWFNEAYMIWDAGGSGRIFGRKVLEARYHNIYYRTDEKSISRKQSDIPGYFFTKENKVDTLGDIRSAMSNREYIVRSTEFIQECREYVYMLSSNSIEHSRSKHTIDPSGAKDNHGDRVIAKALTWKIIKSRMTVPEIEKTEQPKQCFAARREEYMRKQANDDDWSSGWD